MKAILTALGTAAVALVLQGCGSDPESTHQAPDLVRGDFNFVFHHDEGFIKVPASLSDKVISAFTQDENGDFRQHLGSGTDAGNFTIRDVPQGRFYLKINEGVLIFIDSSERTFILGRNIVGMPAAEDAKSASTAIVFDAVGGLEPWQKGSLLELFCSNAGTSGLLNVDEIATGATSLSGLSFAHTWLPSPKLIDGARGDQAVITQLVPQVENGVTFLAVRRAFRPASFTMKNGEATLITGSFEDVPQAEPVSLAWRGAEFVALMADVHPKAVSHEGTVYAHMNPLRGDIAPSEPLMPSLFIAPELTADDADFDVTFGNPFPSEWGVIGQAIFRYGVTIDLPNGAKLPVDAFISYYAPFEEFAAQTGVIKPKLSPVRSLQINGMDATETLSSVGPTPTVSFSPPSLGEAKYFTIRVYEQDPALFSPSTKAVLHTSETSVVMPPGVLEADKQYFLVITAINDGFSSPSKPYVAGSKRAMAQAISGAFTL